MLPLFDLLAGGKLRSVTHWGADDAVVDMVIRSSDAKDRGRCVDGCPWNQYVEGDNGDKRKLC